MAAVYCVGLLQPLIGQWAWRRNFASTEGQLSKYFS